MKLSAKVIVDPKDKLSAVLSYQRISSVNDYNNRAKAIVISTLNPDYFLLFSKIKLVISDKGSKLAHLAILAREHDMPLVVSKGISKKTKTKGRLKLEKNTITIL